jgi:hypothetical protein
MKRLLTGCGAFALLVLLLSFPADVKADHGPPPAKPKRIKGAESFPPLPLPATPLRRTERKRDPTPPVLIGKVRYGKPRAWVQSDGSTYMMYDWESEKGDIPSLLTRFGKATGVRYHWTPQDITAFSGDPDEIPFLYFTGHGALGLSDKELVRLREYVLRGGFVFGNACHGMAAFSAAFKAEMAKIFPDRPFRVLPPDHPLYTTVFQIETVNYSEEARSAIARGEVECDERRPCLEGIDLGCRTAIILSPFDLSCGWNGVKHTKCRGVTHADANRVGVNMLAYALAYHDLGKFLSTTTVYYENEAVARGAFVFGQLRHGGDWDPDPSAAGNLLKAVAALTSGRVKFQRRALDPEGDLSAVPFLYLTGHHDFRLSDRAVTNLRAFLARGGFLLANSCCGRTAFDAAFRREIGRVVPDGLKGVSPDHPLLSCHFKIQEIGYTPLVTRENPGLVTPVLEGITVEGQLRVLYSPFDLGNGWERVDHPFTRGVAEKDAFRIAINAIIYAMTH